MSVLFVVTLVTQDALRKLSTGDIALPTQPGGAKYFVFNASIFSLYLLYAGLFKPSKHSCDGGGA